MDENSSETIKAQCLKPEIQIAWSKIKSKFSFRVLDFRLLAKMGSAVSVGCKPKKTTTVTRDSISQQRTRAALRSESEQDNSRNNKLHQVIDENGFHACHLIDTGGFGFVFKATRNVTRQTYALKVQPMEFMTYLARSGGTHPITKKSLHIERNVLVECRGHPFIVTLEYAFCTRLYAVLAMEYIPGLLSYLAKLVRWSRFYNRPFTPAYGLGGTLSRLITSAGTLSSAVAKIYTAGEMISFLTENCFSLPRNNKYSLPSRRNSSGPKLHA